MDQELYEDVMERAQGRCEAPWCETKRPILEVAHLLGKQMGGSRYRDVRETLIILFRLHHDLLDGRLIPNGRSFEMEQLFRAAIGRQWEGRR